MKLFYLSFIIISSLSFLSTFTININKHYSIIAGNILNLNNILKKNNLNFYTANYYNNNNSLCYTYHNKNNIKYLLKDKYNYLITFEIYKYNYMIILKSKPITNNNTIIDIDIRKKRNLNYYNTNLNFIHYKRIDNIIYKYIYNNIILKNNENELAIDLFKFFNKY